jgi:hypothetical protein
MYEYLEKFIFNNADWFGRLLTICISGFSLIVAFRSLKVAKKREIHHGKQVEISLNEIEDKKKRRIKDITDKFDSAIFHLDDVCERWPVKTGNYNFDNTDRKNISSLYNLISLLPKPYDFDFKLQLGELIRPDMGGIIDVNNIVSKLMVIKDEIEIAKKDELDKYK